MISMNDSKFNMWRACVAFVYLDRKVSPEERKWVEEKIHKLPLSDDQRKVLANDLDNGVPLESVLPLVTDKADLGFLVSTLRVIAHLDHDFSAEEKIAFKKLETKVLGGINLKSIEAEVQRMEKESYHESEVYKNKNRASLFENVFHSFMKWLNPGDYKFPKK